MEWNDITEKEVEGKIKKIKKDKAAGSDNIKPEYIKVIGESKEGIEIITESFNKITYDKEVPEKWKESKTKLIPKNNKPKIKDFRPLAMTNIQYKLYLGIMKDRIEDHLKINNLQKENQMGFTKGYRIEFNHMIIQYLVDGGREKKPLILISVDYTKAFDSIKREKMIESLIKYKIHPYVIDKFVQIYKQDFKYIEHKGKK